MQLEYAAMDMRNEIRSPEEVYKELEALWVKQGRRIVTTKQRPVSGPKPTTNATGDIQPDSA